MVSMKTITNILAVAASIITMGCSSGGGGGSTDVESPSPESNSLPPNGKTSINGSWYSSCRTGNDYNSSSYTVVKIGRISEISTHFFNNPICLGKSENKKELIGGAFIESRVSGDGKPSLVEFIRNEKIENPDWSVGGETSLFLDKESGYVYKANLHDGQLTLDPQKYFETISGQPVNEKALEYPFIKLTLKRNEPYPEARNVADVPYASPIRDLLEPSRCTGSGAEVYVAQFYHPNPSNGCLNCIQSEKVAIIGHGSKVLSIIRYDRRVPPQTYWNGEEWVETSNAGIQFSTNPDWSYQAGELWIGNYGKVFVRHGKIYFYSSFWETGKELTLKEVFNERVTSLLDCQ